MGLLLIIRFCYFKVEVEARTRVDAFEAADSGADIVMLGKSGACLFFLCVEALWYSNRIAAIPTNASTVFLNF